MKQIISNVKDETRKTAIGFVKNAISSKYLITKHMALKENSFRLLKKHHSGVFSPNNPSMDVYGELYNVDEDNIMLYILFRKKYPRNFGIAISDGHMYLMLPKIGFYIRIYKNNLITCTVEYIPRLNNNTQNATAYNNIEDKYTATLNIIGPNACVLFEWLDKKSDRIKHNSKWFVFGNDTIRTCKIHNNGNTSFTVSRFKSLDDIIINKNDMEKINQHLYKLDHPNAILKKIYIKRRVGILLYGPAGTGKSSLAHSIAGSRNTNILMINATNIFDRTIYNITESTKPFYTSLGVYLIEEIDGLLKDESDNKNNILLRRDQVLEFMDSIPNGKIVIATTNHIDKLDPAIIRPGRFDIKIEMPYFSREDAHAFLSRIEGIDLSYMLDKYEYPLCPAQLQLDIEQELSKPEMW